MWRKYMRSYENLTYRKKYRCPICDEYKLNIIHDHALQCENECENEHEDELDIKKIINENDFFKYYELKDIKDLFYEAPKDINNIFNKITDEQLLHSPIKQSKPQPREIQAIHERALELGKIRTKLYSHPVNLGGKRRKKRRNKMGQS